MPNSLNPILDKIVARANLSLRPNLNFIAQANRDFSEDIAKKGDIVNIPKDRESVATDVTPSGNRPDSLPTDEFDNVQMSINQWKEVTFSLNDKERRNIDEQANYLPMVIHSKVRALAEAAEKHVADRYVELYNWVGVAGTTPFSTGTPKDARELIAANKVLNDNNNLHEGRAFIMNTTAEAAALALPEFGDVSQAGGLETKVYGSIGQKYGFNNVVSNFIPYHTTGMASGTTAVVDGAQTAASANAYDSQTGVRTTTLKVKTLSGQPVPGDKFTIAGDAQQYVVVSATTINSTASTLTINPALQEDAGDGDALTILASHTANVAMQRRALTFAQRNLEHDSATNAAISQMQDPVSGLSLRIEAQRAHKADVYSMDLLYGAKYVNPESAVIVAG